MYLDNHYFPIYLFNRHNDIKFQSFDGIKKLVKKIQKNSKFDFERVFHVDNEKELFANALTHFPFMFFITDKININSLPHLFKENPRITNDSRLLKLYNMRIDMLKIQAVFKQINESDGCSVYWSHFLTDIFIILYKYAFFEIAMSIKTSNNGITLNDYMHDYKTYQKSIGSSNSHSFLAIGQIIHAVFADDIDTTKCSMTEFEIISKTHHFSKLLFSFINRNINLNESYSTRVQNEMLRPLFFEVVCNFCYPNDYNAFDTNHRFIVDKFRLFLRGHNKRNRIKKSSTT